MYNTGKIIAGLVIFVAIFTLPIWAQLGKASQAPKLELPKDKKQCVEQTRYMRTSHMQVLDVWRDQVVRDRERVYVGLGGKKYDMSLTDECMSCHNDKKKFCDRCHDYLAVSPYCWDCHLTPEQVKEASDGR
jgi:hypothetical protein